MRLELYKETACPIQKKDVAKVINATLEILKRSKNLSLSLAVVKKGTMQSLNRAWRGKNRPTSVLSFSNNSDSRGKKQKNNLVVPPSEKGFIGEVIIADSVVRYWAKINKSSYRKEFYYFFIHGLFHLLGYNHHTAVAAQKMEKLEKKVISRLTK